MDAGQKHPLLVYRIRYRRHRGLYFIAAIALFAFYVALQVLPPETWAIVSWIKNLDWVMLVLGVVVLLYAIFRWLAASIPYVQCTERNIKIQAPIYQVVFSYKRVREAHTNTLFHMFDNAPLSRSARNFVLSDKYGGHTAIVVEMNSWPMSLRWMRFWLGNLVFAPDGLALVLWVDDWMGLNRELTDFKDRWRDRKRQAQGGAPRASTYQDIFQAPTGKAKKKK